MGAIVSTFPAPELGSSSVATVLAKTAPQLIITSNFILASSVEPEPRRHADIPNSAAFKLANDFSFPADYPPADGGQVNQTNSGAKTKDRWQQTSLAIRRGRQAPFLLRRQQTPISAAFSRPFA